MKRVSFIHAADLHLDSPMVGLKSLPADIYTRVKESTFTALKRITTAAIENQVDFVILAGDLFDGEDRSLRAQSRFRTEMLKLAENNIPVYIVHGNHDHLNGTWVHLDLPKNVHLFHHQVETKVLMTKHGHIIHLYGFSYPQRHVYEKKIDEYQKLPGADFHIGILHGNESGGQEHDNYAPFTIKELYDKEFDYWALGHIHKRKILSENPPIVYPGNIQGRNKKEIGVKGFYQVELTETDASLHFIESSDIIWEEAVINAAEARSFYEVFQLCQSIMNSYRKEKIGTLLTLFLQNVQLNDTKERRSLDSELIDLLMDVENSEKSFVWPVQIFITESLETDKEQLKHDGEFYSELFKTIEEYENITEPMAPLYEHHIGRKYINQLSTTEKQSLIEDAEKLLIKLLS
jgi:DNA repair protein SbcD/Mre11